MSANVGISRTIFWTHEEIRSKTAIVDKYGKFSVWKLVFLTEACEKCFILIINSYVLKLKISGLYCPVK
jgi:hypothetical protein